MLTGDASAVPLTLHAEPVSGGEGKLLGFVLTRIDLREARRADAARLNLESAPPLDFPLNRTVLSHAPSS